MREVLFIVLYSNRTYEHHNIEQQDELHKYFITQVLNTKLIGRMQKSVQIMLKKYTIDFWYTFRNSECLIFFPSLSKGSQKMFWIAVDDNSSFKISHVRVKACFVTGSSFRHFMLPLRRIFSFIF